jgi:uncharacterized membrane protein
VADLSTTQIVLAAAAVVVAIGWIVLIALPAWVSYGRMWERIAASFLTLYILAALLGVGAAIGAAIIWSYDNFA